MRAVYRDKGLLEGTHRGASGVAALYDPNVHFEVTHALGRLLENVTQSTSGVVTAQTLNTATAAGVTWDAGDEYVLYVGAKKNATISSTEVCRRSAFAYPYWELGPGGIHPDHEDADRRVMDGQRARPTKLRR